MWRGTRREFLKTTTNAAVGVGLGLKAAEALAQIPGERPKQDAAVKVLNPRMRVPLSFIIDDSTCLVNLNRFAIPQFAAGSGRRDRYERLPWRKMPHEIPDDFVRKFGEWCGEREIKGKYSIVPFPACVGRLDRELPGWTPKEVAASIELVRDLMLPNWDIHPEMVTHTRVIDLKTGHPYPERSPKFMENWQWTDGKSTDELAAYSAYALKILKNVGLPCEGITTPGGYASRVIPELAQATLQSVRDVFGAEIPHYFKFVTASGDRSVAPRVEYASGLDTDDPKCVVSLIACTGDWTGGWDNTGKADPDLFITPDLKSGRMVEVIDRREPAIMLCHWTGIYFDGKETGFKVFQEAVKRMHTKYDHLLWMKLSEIARYWAAKELTRIEKQGNTITFSAPFACPQFTLRLPANENAVPKLTAANKPVALKEVAKSLQVASNTWLRDKADVVVCFDLKKGTSTLRI